jgi:hypothetical protein
VIQIQVILKTTLPPSLAHTFAVNPTHKVIELSLDYFYNRSVFEMQGVLCHEMVHVWQFDALGTLNSGLVEGIADYFRLQLNLLIDLQSTNHSDSTLLHKDLTYPKDLLQDSATRVKTLLARITKTLAIDHIKTLVESRCDIRPETIHDTLKTVHYSISVGVSGSGWLLFVSNSVFWVSW